jgi:hypothetical protein
MTVKNDVAAVREEGAWHVRQGVNRGKCRLRPQGPTPTEQVNLSMNL